MNETLKYTLRFLIAVGVLMFVMHLFLGRTSNPTEPEKAIAPLDFSKPVYTTYRTVICPQTLITDPRESHSGSRVAIAFMSHDEKDAEKLGCQVWQSGIQVTANPMGEKFAEINGVAFTMLDDLTNNADGSTRYVDSSATPSKNVQSSFGHWLVTKPSSDPIPKGIVVGSAEGSGDVICPDSNAFAEYDDAALAWFAAHGSDVLKEDAPSQLNFVNEETKELAKQHGCNYLSPGTLMMSEGGNQTGSMAIVTAKMLDGTAIRGVTLPSSITQDPQRLEAAKKQAQGQDSTPSTSSPEISRQPEPPGKAVDPTLVWIDPKSGLAWAKKDNGTDVTWQAAMAYCQNLRIDGQSDWRLPTIEELQGIYDSTIQAPDPNNGGRTVPWQVRGNLLLSAWGEWSSSQGNSPGQALVFGFGNGAAFSYRFEGQKKPRALCVRSPLQPESGFAGKAPS